MSLLKLLNFRVNLILKQKWNIRKGIKVPNVESLALYGGGIKINATIFYADLIQSSILAKEFQQRTASKIIKAFLFCASQIITSNKGKITSFDGDRVMGIFMGNNKECNAIRSAFKLNYAIDEILRPKLNSHFQSFNESAFDINHVVGIDTSDILAVRVGLKGSNEITWVGKAPNFAAKLSDIREKKYNIYITKSVYDKLSFTELYDNESMNEIWDERISNWYNQKWKIYSSNFSIEI